MNEQPAQRDNGCCSSRPSRHAHVTICLDVHSGSVSGSDSSASMVGFSVDSAMDAAVQTTSQSHG